MGPGLKVQGECGMGALYQAGQVQAPSLCCRSPGVPWLSWSAVTFFCCEAEAGPFSQPRTQAQLGVPFSSQGQPWAVSILRATGTYRSPLCSHRGPSLEPHFRPHGVFPLLLQRLLGGQGRARASVGCGSLSEDSPEQGGGTFPAYQPLPTHPALHLPSPTPSLNSCTPSPGG